MWEVDQIVKDCINKFDFHLMFITLLNFCSNDLSAFYFDIRKDTIYCDSSSSLKRRSARSLLDIIFNFLVRWFAPSLSFTSEEAWKARGSSSSIHLEDFLTAKEIFCNHDLKDKWNIIKQVRRVVTGALEKKRADKIIGSTPLGFFAFMVANKFTLFLSSSKTLKDEAPHFESMSSH